MVGMDLMGPLMSVYVCVCRQVGAWRDASCEQGRKQAWQEGVSLCSWVCQGGSGVSEVVRVSKKSDSSGGGGQQCAHHHPKEALFAHPTPTHKGNG